MPNKLKIIKGTFRNCRANPKEPDPPVELPEAPSHLTEYGRAEWDDMAKKVYNMGILSHVDKACLAGYCQLYGRWRQAEEDLEKSSLIIKTTSGNIIQNPLLGIANTAYKLMKDSLTEFGMTPASRSKVSAKKTKKKKDAWAEFG